MSRNPSPPKLDNTSPALTVELDDTAPPGNVLRPLAVLLLSLARRQQSARRGEAETHLEQKNSEQKKREELPKH